MNCSLLLFLLHFLTSCVFSQRRNHSKCIDNVLSHTFRNCSPVKREKEKCSEYGVCRKQFRISVVNLEPYTSGFQEVMKNVLRYCCGNCVNFTELSYTNGKTIDHDKADLTKIDILYPVLGYTKQEQSHGYYFIPILDVPVGFYFRHQPSATTTTVTLIKTCLRLWPLGTICLMMALIAGFIVWALETWINVHQFPRPFISGVFEGFWWSFISMTTVGYGDKYPKSCCARMFAVVWILIGITVCSMFTASLTSAISSVDQQTTSEMSGMKIGVLRNRMYDSLIVSRHGGTPVETGKNLSTVRELVKMLGEGKVEGIFLDKFVLAEEKHRYYLQDYARTEVTYDGEHLSYGVLMMNMSDYTYFNDFIKDNRMQLEACVSKAGHRSIMAPADADVYVFSANMFWQSFLGTGCIIAVIAFFGCIYEIKRRKGKWTRAPSCCRPKGDDNTGGKSPKSPRIRKQSTNSVKRMLNQTPEEALQTAINKDLRKMIHKWKADGMV